MAQDHKSDELSPDQSYSPARPEDAPVLDRVQELTWALIDEQISTDEFRLLENLLLSDDAARDTYLGCVQLHVGLMNHYAEPATASSGTRSTVLGFLNEGAAALGGTAPAPEDSHS